MAPPKDYSHQNGSGTCHEIEDYELPRLLNRTRPLNIERNISFSEFKSFGAEMPNGHFQRNNSDHNHEYASSSPLRRSGFNTPRSNGYYESHPMFADAWESLRRSLVHFRGQPVGTIAAVDHSVEELNYDQVNPRFTLVLFYYCLIKNTNNSVFDIYHLIK